MAHTNQLGKKYAGNQEILYVIPLDDLKEELRQRKLRTTKSFAGFVSPAKDTYAAIQICRELGFTGRVVISNAANGNSYVIIKGYPGIRSVLTGTRYLESNVKVVKMGIGRMGVAKAFAQGTYLTIVLYCGIDVLEYIFDEQATLSMLSGTLATDMMKVGISSIVSAAAYMIAGTFTTVAAAPWIAVIFFGVATNLTLELLDEKYQITDKIVAAIESHAQEFAKKREQMKNRLSRKYYEIEREVMWRMYELDIDNPGGF